MPAKLTLRLKPKFAILAASTILACTPVPGIAGSPTTETPIKHIVVIYGENESFDHYFGTYPYAVNPSGQPGVVARDDTPTANTLLAAGLDEQSKPKAALPSRSIRGLHLRHGSRLHRRTKGV
jgi:hypothetical protein